jgi:cytochrome b6-f complex iron-sulfur subunit
MTPVPRTLPRRTVLAASGTAVLAVAAACSSDPTPAPATTSPAATTSSAASSSSAAAPRSTVALSSAPNSATAALTSAFAPTSTAAPAPAGNPVATVADVEAAGSIVVGDKPILLCAANGTVVGHTAICTHQGCTVAAGGADANCPCHGSKFNAATGAVINGPALSPLAEVAVTVANGQVYAG